MADAVIVSTARTPIGKAFRGVFNDTHGADMGAHVIKHAAERAKERAQRRRLARPFAVKTRVSTPSPTGRRWRVGAG